MSKITPVDVSGYSGGDADKMAQQNDPEARAYTSTAAP